MRTTHPTGLKLVIGPANSGKMGYLMNWWRERMRLAPVVVTPTVPDARELSREMAKRAGGLVGQSPALTFDGLVRLVLGRSPRYASDLERSLLLLRILRQVPLEVLGSTLPFPGLPTALAALLQQLSESGRPPDELDRILDRWASEPAGGGLARDIRALAAAYAGESERSGLVDRATAVRQATAQVESWTRPVALYGFTSFTVGQRALVDALAGRVEVLVVFTYDPARAVHLTTADEIAWWRARATEIEQVVPATLAYDSPAIGHLERHLMNDGPRPGAPAKTSGSLGVRFLLGSGRRAEAELAAQEMAGLLRSGFHAGDIAVVVRGLQRWSSLLGQVFDSCGIPFHMDDRRMLTATGLGSAFSNALEAVALDDAHSLFAYLRSPFSGVPPEEVCDLELRYRRGTTTGARSVIDAADGTGVASVTRLLTMVEEAGAAAGDDRLRFRPEAAEVLAAGMLRAGLRGATVGSREVEDDARAFHALQAALKTVADMAPGGADDSLDPRLVLQLLAQVTVPAGQVEEGEAVQVLSVQRARARRFKAVFILGLVEGEFPGRTGTVSLLNRSQRDRLDAIGGGLFSRETDQEAGLFLSAVSRASQVLFLSARDAEDDGGDATPSHFWQSAKRLLGVADGEHAVRSLADQAFAPHAAPTLRHYLRACAVLGLPLPSDAATDAVAVPIAAWSCPPSRLVTRQVLDELESVECFDSSALESYAGCPFRWFVERVVGVDDVDFDLDNRVVGQLLHKALSAVYPRLHSAGLLPLRREGVRAAEQMASTAVDTLVAGEDCPGSPAERRLAGWRLKRMARNLFEMEVSAAGMLELSETEMWVGGREGVDIGGFRLRGRIDRVDLATQTGALFVFDYKTGSIPALSAIGAGEGLQLPLYLMALAAERPDTVVGGGAYLGLKDKKRAGVVKSDAVEALGPRTDGYRLLDDQAAEELFHATHEVATAAVAGMRAGVIAPRPDRTCPFWCTLGPACRSRRGGYRP
ncbi:MAG: PD-(D/E)XK nuclease family protein [Thermoleophilia bacterium]|nr:PD-(D/E)XK nuclease family protein [Thermoleophilia bacterium]